ncbi:hypothetical protein Aduo_001859 [Ancylostoma duodenale]
MPTSFAFSSLDLHFWRKPSVRKANSDLAAEAQGVSQPDSARIAVSHSIQRDLPSPATAQRAVTTSTTTTTRTQRVHSLQKDSYFWDHEAGCRCQLCKRR